MRAAFAALAALVAAGTSGCRGTPASELEATLENRERQVAQRMAESGAGAEMEPVARWVLPGVLREISGIALTGDGRILAHNDERGRVYVIDPRRGVITKQFSVGSKTVVADFEGIAVSGDDIFLLASNGNVYQFREGDDGKRVDFTLYDTKLGKECEFEGIAIERGTGAFLLVCKVISKRSERNQLRIYRWVRESGGRGSVSTINVPLAEAIGTNGWKALSPSDITIDPKTGNYILITGPEKALIEITASGSVVRSLPLPSGLQQPEGVAITSDGLIILADEGVTGPGNITIYPWRASAAIAASPPADSVSEAVQQANINR